MESGTDRKKILLISSSNPNNNSPKMVFDMVKSLETGGHIVDLLFKYPEQNDSVNILSVMSGYDIFKERFLTSLKWRISSVKNRLGKPKPNKAELNYHFFTTNEQKPPVKSSLILKQIKVKYDFVIIFFWQGMLTSKSLFDIYQKVKVPILLISADMYPITGGCSYFWDCRNFEHSCGKCPAFLSTDEHDFTRKTFLYRQQVYSSINCVFLGNGWMAKHAVRSGMFNNIDTIYPVINENDFKPQHNNQLKEALNLKNKLILFTGSVDIKEDRKGFNYLVEALQILTEQAPDLTSKVVLVIAGGSSVDIKQYFKLEVLELGRVPFEDLALYYAMADIYLSPSIQDAGPMMVNQAMMCGTPVVAFDMGTAHDIINDETGYLAKYKDSNDFARGVIKLLRLPDSQKQHIAYRCREISMNLCSYSAFENRIIEIYKRLSN